MKPPSIPPDRSFDALDALLDRIERDLARALDSSAESSVGLHERLLELEAWADPVRALPPARARRVADAQRRLLLAARSEPSADFVADVIAQLPEPGGAAWRRAALGSAFLDGPTHLRRWRRAAIAATVLAASAVGIAAQRGALPPALEHAGGLDPRIGLLEPLDPAGPSVRGAPSSFAGLVASPHVAMQTGRGLRVLPLRVVRPVARDGRGLVEIDRRLLDRVFGDAADEASGEPDPERN